MHFATFTLSGGVVCLIDNTSGLLSTERERAVTSRVDAAPVHGVFP